MALSRSFAVRRVTCRGGARCILRRFSSRASSFDVIPIIDLFADDAERTVLDACSRVGVFYVKTPSRDFDALGAEFLDEARAFFARSDMEKAKISFNDSPHWRGYAAYGNEVTFGRADLREQIDLSLPEHESTYPPRAGDALFNVIRGPNQWPEDSGIKDLAIRWFRSTVEVSDRLGEVMGLALGIGREAFRHMQGGKYTRMKICNYAEEGSAPHTRLQAAAREEGRVWGCGPHKGEG